MMVPLEVFQNETFYAYKMRKSSHISDNKIKNIYGINKTFS